MGELMDSKINQLEKENLLLNQQLQKIKREKSDTT